MGALKGSWIVSGQQQTYPERNFVLHFTCPQSWVCCHVHLGDPCNPFFLLDPSRSRRCSWIFQHSFLVIFFKASSTSL